jgi:hypothetical protein
VGQSEQFAKRTFAEETEGVTHGAVVWQDPPEMGLVKVQGDGLLLVKRPEGLRPLASPWPFACGHEEVLVELKMPGDHLDVRAVQRALLRRQARQVQRVEDGEPPWLGEQPLWMIAPHVPEVLGRIRKVKRRAPGCYHIGPSAFPLSGSLQTSCRCATSWLRFWSPAQDVRSKRLPAGWLPGGR